MHLSCALRRLQIGRWPAAAACAGLGVGHPKHGKAQRTDSQLPERRPVRLQKWHNRQRLGYYGTGLLAHTVHTPVHVASCSAAAAGTQVVRAMQCVNMGACTQAMYNAEHSSTPDRRLRMSVPAMLLD